MTFLLSFCISLINHFVYSSTFFIGVYHSNLYRIRGYYRWVDFRWDYWSTNYEPLKCLAVWILINTWSSVHEKKSPRNVIPQNFYHSKISAYTVHLLFVLKTHWSVNQFLIVCVGEAHIKECVMHTNDWCAYCGSLDTLDLVCWTHDQFFTV